MAHTVWGLLDQLYRRSRLRDVPESISYTFLRFRSNYPQNFMHLRILVHASRFWRKILTDFEFGLDDIFQKIPLLTRKVPN